MVQQYTPSCWEAVRIFGSLLGVDPSRAVTEGLYCCTIGSNRLRRRVPGWRSLHHVPYTFSHQPYPERNILPCNVSLFVHDSLLYRSCLGDRGFYVSYLHDVSPLIFVVRRLGRSRFSAAMSHRGYEALRCFLRSEQPPLLRPDRSP